MKHTILLFLALLLIAGCKQSEKDEGLAFAKQVIETYFEKDCKKNFSMWADSIVLLGFSESKLHFKEPFPNASKWCYKFNTKRRFYGDYTLADYLNDYELRIYSKSEFTDKKFMMEKENDSSTADYLNEYHFLFSDHDYLFSGLHLKEGKSLERIDKHGKWVLIISKTKQGWKIVGTL